MDRAGRIVLPRIVRERLGLTGPAQIELVDAADGVVLRPVGSDVPTSRDPTGWVVFHSDTSDPAAKPIDPVAAVEEERNRRIRGITDK
jgi:bifunctional DNA-binding transcriptional regulator/antitoxin component of YhaV-PrlF toxin-antitoxin module